VFTHALALIHLKLNIAVDDMVSTKFH